MRPHKSTKSGPAGQHGHALELDVKAVTEQGEFEGYASVFSNVDAYGDMVMPGAFAASLKKRGAKGVKMFRDHDTRKIIGLWTGLEEDKKGLKARGQLLLDLQDGREAHTLLKAGALDGLSIGFMTVKQTWNKVDAVRELRELDLREISVVTFPANPKAVVQAVKEELPTEREFEAWLVRDAGFTRSQARTIIASGFKSLKGVRDAAGGEEAAIAAAIRRAAEALRS